MVKINNRFSGEEIVCGESGSILALAEQEKMHLQYADLRNADLRDANFRNADLRDANLRDADLRNANLRDADLQYADLRDANLRDADLQYADLRYANLQYADLRNADLRDANFRNADLRYANLQYADLRDANLRDANLWDANLRNADLRDADLQFHFFPSIRTISSIRLHDLPDEIVVELMRRDAAGHPYPERFDEWAKGGECPYRKEERFWLFEEKRELWKKGIPKMIDRDLIFAICKSQGWKIKGYLK